MNVRFLSVVSRRHAAASSQHSNRGLSTPDEPRIMGGKETFLICSGGSH